MCIVDTKLANIESDIVEMGVKPISFPVSFFNAITCVTRVLLYLSKGQEFVMRARWGTDYFSNERRLILTVSPLTDSKPGIVKAEEGLC